MTLIQSFSEYFYSMHIKTSYNVGVDRGVSNPRFPPPLSPLPSPSLPASLPLSPCFPPPLSPRFPPPASLPLSPHFPLPLPRFPPPLSPYPRPPCPPPPITWTCICFPRVLLHNHSKHCLPWHVKILVRGKRICV